MGDQKPSMEKVSCGGMRRRRRGGLSIPPVNGGGCNVGVGVGVGVGIAAFAVAVVGAAVVRARRARREDRTAKRSFGEDEDNERIEEEEIKGEEENASTTISQRREEMGEETEEISFQIDREDQSIGKLNLSPRREDTAIVAIDEEERIILKAGNDGNCDRESSEESKVNPSRVEVSEEAHAEKEENKKEDSMESEKAECEPSVEFEAAREPSIEHTLDGANEDPRASLVESGVFEAAAEAVDSASKTEENDFSTKKREGEWKLEDDVNRVSRGEPKKIEVGNATKTIAIGGSEVGFAIANRPKGGLLVISAFVLAVVLLLFVRRDRPIVFELSTM